MKAQRKKESVKTQRVMSSSPKRIRDRIKNSINERVPQSDISKMKSIKFSLMKNL